MYNIIEIKDKEKVFNEVKEKLEELFNEKIKANREQMAAAYALNMCTVSISQIVEYQDLNIMEQEYENILNNLNLENIAKDEALLDLIKQILNVITFFRISDGDRKMIEKRYQQKMKNAIWSSIPSPSVLLGAGLPGIVLSVVSMVGTGYMNYRKAKAEGTLEMEEEKWKLQRSAIDQLNGLRRELFSAAWKFAEKYEYPEMFRITERQIKQYNEILMDSNLIRKYYRLLSVKKNFIAYPDFWYYLAHTTNEIYRMSDDNLFDNKEIKGRYSELEINRLERTLTPEERNTFKEEAKKYFEIYMNLNRVSPLLRENHVASTCALEYVDLLFDDKEWGRIEKYIDDAVRFSGNANDILQLCAIAYLRINKREKAVDLFNILINEEYNTEMNAQLLSGIYISMFNECNKERNIDNAQKNKANYDLLVCRIGLKNQAYIIPWPDERDGDCSAQFIKKQKELLKIKIRVALEEYRDMYSRRFGNIIPFPCFKGRNASISDRDYLRLVFDNSRTRNEYRSEIYSSAFITEYCLLADEMVSNLCSIKRLSPEQDKYREIIEESICKKKDDFLSLQTSLQDNSYDLSDYDMMIMLADGQPLANQSRIFESLYSSVKKKTDSIIDGTSDMAELMAISNDIDKFCEDRLGHSIVVELEKKEKDSGSSLERKRIGYKSFNENIYNQITDRIKGKGMLKVLQDADVSGLEKSKIKVLLRGTKEFDEFFAKEGFVRQQKVGCYAVIDDNSRNNKDMLLTVDGVMQCSDNEYIGSFPYSECAEKKKLSELMSKTKLDDDELEKLADIFSKLNMMSFEE